MSVVLNFHVNTADMSELSPIDKLVRKLRKKLREIERLEISDRSSLNREEISKVVYKSKVSELYPNCSPVR